MNKSIIVFKRLLFFFISVLVINSCYTPSFKDEIVSLDSLATTLKNSRAELLKIDTVAVYNDYETFIRNMFMLEKVNVNKLDEGGRMVVDEYKSLGNVFLKPFKMQYNDYLKEIDDALQQIGNLKDDLTNGILPKSSFDTYFGNEKASSDKLNENLQIFITYTHNYIKKFENLNPKIIQIGQGKR